jgi:hypothetical protein
MLSDEDIIYMNSIKEKIKKLKSFLNENDFGNDKNNFELYYQILNEIKNITGNIYNDLSFISCLLAEKYLMKHHNFSLLDITTKAQGAPGLDIDEITIDGERVIGEIKTTYPYKKKRLGSNQKKSFKNDFKKLSENDAKYKYFFLTEEKTFEIVKEKYLDYLEDVNIVLLMD